MRRSSFLAACVLLLGAACSASRQPPGRSAAVPPADDAGSPPPHEDSPVPLACRGAALRLTPPFEPCTCAGEERGTRPDGGAWVREGTWCGPRHPREGNLTVQITAPAPLHPGERGTARVVARNTTDHPIVQRMYSGHVSTRVHPEDGGPFFGSSGPPHDEVWFDVPPGGSLAFDIDVEASTLRPGKDGGATRAALAPGSYVLDVFLLGLGGEWSQSVPFEVR